MNIHYLYLYLSLINEILRNARLSTLSGNLLLTVSLASSMQLYHRNLEVWNIIINRIISQKCFAAQPKLNHYISYDLRCRFFFFLKKKIEQRAKNIFQFNMFGCAQTSNVKRFIDVIYYVLWTPYDATLRSSNNCICFFLFFFFAFTIYTFRMWLFDIQTFQFYTLLLLNKKVTKEVAKCRHRQACTGFFFSFVNKHHIIYKYKAVLCRYSIWLHNEFARCFSVRCQNIFRSLDVGVDISY